MLLCLLLLKGITGGGDVCAVAAGCCHKHQGYWWQLYGATHQPDRLVLLCHVLLSERVFEPLRVRCAHNQLTTTLL